jgi:DNA-directed RNA polymerase alpha subunit
MEQTNMNKSIYEISYRLYNVLMKTDKKTGDIVKSYKDNQKFLLNYRGLGKKSNEELKSFLDEHKLI